MGKRLQSLGLMWMSFQFMFAGLEKRKALAAHFAYGMGMTYHRMSPAKGKELVGQMKKDMDKLENLFPNKY